MADNNPFDAIVSQDQASGDNPFDSVVSTGNAPPPASNPFDQAVVDGEKRRTRQQFLETLKNSKDIIPERQAQAIETAQLRGVPVGVAYKYLEDLQPKPVTADFDSMTHKAPATARLLADPVKGPVAFPDAQPLADIEDNLKAFTQKPGFSAEQFHRSASDASLSNFLSAIANLGNKTPEESAIATEQNVKDRAAAVDAAQNAPAERLAQEQGAAAGFADFEAQRGNPGTPDPMALPKPYADARAAEDQRNVEASRKALDVALKNPVTQDAWRNFFDSVVGSAIGTLSSVTRDIGSKGDVMNALLPDGLETFLYSRFPQFAVLFTPESLRNEKGQGILTQGSVAADDLIAQAFPGDPSRRGDFSTMLGSGVGSMGVFAAAGYIARSFGISANAAVTILGALSQGGASAKDAADAGASPVVQLLSNLAGNVSGATEGWVGWDKMLAGFPDATTLAQKLAQIGLTAGKEGTQEFSQQIISDSVPVLTYDKARDIFGNAFSSALVGAITGGGLSAITTAATAASEFNHQRIIALGEAAKKAKLADLAPKILDEHIAQLKQSGAAPEHVTAPAEAVETLFQELDPENLGQMFPKTAQSLRDAKATGSEVTIPTEELVRLGKLKGYSNFASDVRIGDDMTLNETVKLREDVTKYLADQGKSEGAPSQEDSPVYQDLRNQLIGAGQSPEVATAQARLFDAVFTNLSERTGVPVQDLARRYGLTVSNSAMTEAAGQTTLAQPVAPSLASIEESAKAAGVSVDLAENKGVITLSKIVAAKKGQGAGTKVMLALIQYADATGQRIALSPSADFGGSKSRLQQFYKRFGFAENKGRAKDFAVSETMIREPVKTITLNQGMISDVVNRIKAVIDAARGKGHANEKAVIAPVAQWLADAAKENGLDIEGYTHTIDGSGVRHTFNEHGNAKTEAARGQIAITDADLEAVPQVIASPDEVVFGGVSRLGKPMIGYLKRMPDGTVLYVEETRTGKRELALLSMWKYPGARDFSSLGTLLSNARSDAGDGIKIITPPSDVKSLQNEPPQGGSSASGATLNQGGKQDIRGSIQFTALRDKFHITLTEKANLSTFIHEGGHFFLEILQDLVERGEASAQQSQDLATLKKWMGIKDADKIERNQHEKFARSWEQYIMEGKAPSLALHGIFQKFKAWMIFVYKRLANVRGDLNEEVRSIMDRLVASDAAIAEARALVGWRGQPMTQEETGLDDAGYQAYLGAHAKASDAQAADADARIMLEAAREMKKTWAEEKAKVTKQVEAEVHSTRGWTAWKLLEDGQGLEAYGRTTIKIDPETLPKEWRGDARGMTATSDQGGMDFDLVAEMLGFETGEQMMQLIGGAKMAEKAIGMRVRQIMAERHGEMDAAQISEEAMRAVHNTPTMEVLLTEFRALAAKAQIKVGKDTLRILQMAAEERVAKLTARQLEPSKWRRAEVKAAEEAGKAAGKGNAEEAAIAKRKQLMAAAMVRASLDAQDRIERMKDYLATFTLNRRRAALGKAGQTYLDAVDQILEGAQLKDVTLKNITARKSLNEIITEAEAAGEPVFVSDETKALLGRKNYTELTLEELTGIHDAVKNLWTIAKEVTTLRKGAEKIALENALADIEKETDATLPVRKQRDHLNPTKIGKMMEGISRYHAGNLKIEFILDWLGNTAHSLIYQPITNASFESWKLHRDLTAPFMEKLRNLPKEQKRRWNTKRQFLNYPMPLKGANIWTIALNMGNASNKEKLLLGYGWTESQVMAELNTFMTKEDWDLVQETLDTIEKMWPKMSQVVQRATGLVPPKIEATEIQTPYGTYRGGYYPVVYDTQIDARMDDIIDSSISTEEMFSKRFTAFVVNNGFTKGRTKVTGKLLLSPDIIAQHLGEVIHYATHYEAVKQADKIIRSPVFKSLVKSRLGDAVYSEMKQWLKDVATNTTRSDRQQQAGDKALRFARTSAQLTSLGLNIKSALKQPLGIITTLDALKTKHWSIGIAKAWLSPSAASNWKFAFAHSKELGPLIKNYDRDAATAARAYADSIGDRTRARVYEVAFMPISVMQAVANVAAWHGAYSQATEKGMSEQDAYDFADKIVRTTQGSGALKDLSGLQRGGEANKFFTMFYSYFGVLYNRIADVQVRESGMKNLHRKVGRLTVLLLMGELLNTLGDDAWDAMFPPDKKKEDDTPFLVRLALNTVDSSINTLPIARDVYGLASAALTHSQGRPPPALAGIIKAGQGLGAIGDLATGKDMTRAKARNIAALAGVLTNQPVYGVYRMLDSLFGAKIFDE